MVMVKVRPSLSGVSGRRPEFSHSFISALTDKFFTSLGENLLFTIVTACAQVIQRCNQRWHANKSSMLQLSANSRLFQKFKVCIFDANTPTRTNYGVIGGIFRKDARARRVPEGSMWRLELKSHTDIIQAIKLRLCALLTIAIADFWCVSNFI